MPTSIVDAFGNAMEVCSISTQLKASLPKLSWLSEAQWMADVKKGAFYTLRQKILNGEVPLNTVVARTGDGAKMVYKKIHGAPSVEMTFKGQVSKLHKPLEDFEFEDIFEDKDWDFGPNMAKMAKQQQAIVDTPAKLEGWLNTGGNQIDLGDEVATLTHTASGNRYKLTFEGVEEDSLKPMYKMGGKNVDQTIFQENLESWHKTGAYKIEYKVGQTPAVPPAANGFPVASTSKSVGALTNEDAATMFVKVKDQLALENGINIKGASAKLDDLVYKTIADQAGYTPTEMAAKVQAYKDSGKKLSALKKKVLPKSGNPTKAPTQASVNKATDAVKKEELKPEEVVQVWDNEAVAKAYVKAKDHVVANNNNGWTLYTKNDSFDAEIHKWMQADLGPIKKANADTAIANYIANTQKLSVLKKQMIKKGELTPQADTLKTKKIPGGVENTDDLKKMIAKNDEAYADSTVAVLKDKNGFEYQLKFKGIDENDLPIYEFHYPSGTVQKMHHAQLEYIIKNDDYTIEYKIKPAPKETGAGQVGKTTEDPKVIAPEKQLTEAQESEMFAQWEASNLPLSGSAQAVYEKAKFLANAYGLGDDVLPILKAIDKLKTKKFGYSPDQNKFLYEKKVLEHLANPKPSGYVPPTSSSFTSGHIEQAAKVFGEDPPDLDLFKPISPEEMTNLHRNAMGAPTPEQQSALRTYSGSAYRELNGHLRQGGSVTANRTIRTIQESMKPLPENITVRRGTSLQGIGLDSFDQLEGAIGKTFVEKGFSSTAVGGSGQFSGQVNLVIQVPKGARAAWLKPYSSFSHENELLLEAGTKFRIVKVEVKSGPYGGTTNVVHVRVEP